MMLKMFSTLLVVALTCALLPTASAAASKGSYTFPSPNCLVFYERSAAAVIGPYNFTGSNPGTEIQSFNTPFFYKLSDAKSSTCIPDGRVLGFNSIETSSGTWSFQFFATNSWITTIFGFGCDGAPNVITGGTGCYLDEQGVVTSSIVPNTGSLFIIEWKFFFQKGPRDSKCQQPSAKGKGYYYGP